MKAMLISRATFSCVVLVLLFCWSNIEKVIGRVLVPLATTVTNDNFRVGCSFNINKHLVEPQPLFLKPKISEFLEANTEGTIEIRSGGVIEFYCTESFTKPFRNRYSILATCLMKDIFIVSGKRFLFEEFTCLIENESIAKRTNEVCFQNSTIIDIGFELKDRFIKLMKVCHDEINESTLYVQHNLTKSSASFQKSVPRVDFIEGDFYNNKDVNYLYTKKKQVNTIRKILGGNHEKYFNTSSDMYLARGHLAAKTDFIYGSLQRATFFFINAAPQWQRFNGGNWERIEDGIRRYVTKNKIDIICFTGIYDILKLPHKNGNLMPLYLYIDENNNGQIPVPKLYFRVIIEPLTQKGIVFIGINNPHATLDEIQKDYIICDDISDKIAWIKWKKDNIGFGYSYACEVNQFVRVVKTLPVLNISGILV